MAKIMVALSGGVDSAVAALKLLQQGHQVGAVYARTWLKDDDFLAECPAKEDIENASAVSKHLGIPFTILSVVKEYRQRIVDYLVAGYRQGLTPNPDIMCNREMKFGILRDHAIAQGYDGFATGHYCQIERNDQGVPIVLEGADPNKDQSYFLAMVLSDQLKNAYFPIGTMEKSNVRAIARTEGLPNADRKDSQGICFLGKTNINQFLSEFIPDHPGPIVNHQNKVVGEHRGLHQYTIGQRKGIGVPSNTDHQAYVVVGKDLTNHTLKVAFDEHRENALFTERVLLRDLNWQVQPSRNHKFLHAKVRYRDAATPIETISHPDGTVEVIFREKQRAIARGQVLAFYESNQLLGGGFYEKIY